MNIHENSRNFKATDSRQTTTNFTMGEVSVDVKADTNAAVNAPVLTGNTITGTVNINYTSNIAERQNCTETSKNNAQKQVLQEFLRSHKIYMKEDSESIFEGKKENEADLNEIYTDLFITEGDMKEVNCEREILNVDDAFKKSTKRSHDKHIKCNEIFQSQKTKKKKKIILTKGVAGIGKTVSVQKLILDWAEGTDPANQDVDAMFLFPFSKINQIKDKGITFHEFLLEFYFDMEKLEKISVMKLIEGNVAFIFDGLDESRLSMDFNCRKLRSVEERSSVDEMIINLIRGDLLPSSLIWITSRPAAANQIPPEFVGLFTEVRGFTDQHKEEYFRKRIKDESQADEMIKHIKRSRSLYIMCHIPVFCWITASVLHDILIQNNEGSIDTTLTEMYIHFLLIQMNMKNQKYNEKNEQDYPKLLESNKTIVLKLSKLAFEQLKKENIIFYEKDLKECDIDMSEDSEYTGMIAEIFKKEYGLHKRKVFSFIHLSVQEFLAALHVFICYMTNNKKDLEFFNTRVRARKITLHDILKKAIDKAIESERGHLDLFLRFLMGISLESSQKLLEGLLTRTEDTTDSITDTTQYIKRLQDKRISDEASVNLFYCLMELKDQSLNERIEKYLHPDDSDSVIKLSDSMCTLMIYVLLMSENVLDEFNMNRYDIRDKMRLVPAVRCCRRALLSGCDLTAESCEVVASAFQSSECPLIELDMGNNDLKDSGVKLIYDALKTHNCQLQILRLSRCNVTDECCEHLSSCLQSSKSLRELDMSNNDLKDSGVKLISDALKTHNCQLEILRLSGCNLTDECCESLSSCLQSSNSLRELDLSNNDLKDSGVKLISDALKTHNCQLQTLRLSGCMVTDKGCCYLASALSSNPSHLRELDLSYNHPQHSALQLLSDILNDPNYTLNKLKVDHVGERRITAGPRKWVCDLSMDPNTGNTLLILSEENRKITGVRERQSYPDHPDRFDRPQVLCGESLTGRCYWETDWSGSGVYISVSYESINRKGRSHDSLFGFNVKSWSLDCSKNRFTAWHNKNKTVIDVSSGVCRRVGVYVDFSAGTLSFYSVSDTHTLTHLHTFNTTFTEPLCAGFRVYGSNSSVSLCDINSLSTEPPVKRREIHTQPGNDDPSLKDAVKALSIKDEGTYEEPVQLTRFHAKIVHPSFSLKTLIINCIMSWDEHCDLLMYMSCKDPLILHVYFFPFDDLFKNAVEKEEISSYQVKHPRPDKPFRMKTLHFLNVPGASVHPREGITLRRDKMTLIGEETVN